MYISGAVLQKKKKPKTMQSSTWWWEPSVRWWENLSMRTIAGLMPTSPLQPLLSHVTVLHCHRPSERGISSAQLKAGKWAPQAAAARYSCYIQILQGKEDGSSWQGALDWEAAFRGPGSQPGNWIPALSLINVLQNILPLTVLRVSTEK